MEEGSCRRKAEDLERRKHGKFIDYLGNRRALSWHRRRAADADPIPESQHRTMIRMSFALLIDVLLGSSRHSGRIKSRPVCKFSYLCTITTSLQLVGLLDVLEPSSKLQVNELLTT